MTRDSAAIPADEGRTPLPTRLKTVPHESTVVTPVQPSDAVVSIGPMRITTLSTQALTERIVEGIFAGLPTQHVVTANAQFYVLAQRDPQFRECLDDAAFVCADGLPIVRMCNWMGATAVERITGIDLVPLLCAQAARLDLPVYFLGGESGSAAAAASQLMDQFPGLRVCGVGCPPLGFENSPRILREVLGSVEAARPAVIFVAFGAPKQEFFIRQHIKPMGIPVAIGVGGSFEMLAGVRRRAPGWAQSAGMEWAFRLAQEPRRLSRRYLLGNSVFSYYALRYLLSDAAIDQRDQYRATIAQQGRGDVDGPPVERGRELS